MKELLTCIGISGIALLISELTPFVRIVKSKLNLKRLKPLDCSLCLSFWLAVGYSIATQSSLSESIFYIGASPILSLVTLKYLQS